MSEFSFTESELQFLANSPTTLRNLINLLRYQRCLLRRSGNNRKADDLNKRVRVIRRRILTITGT